MAKYTEKQLEKMVDDKINSLTNEWVSIGELAYNIFEYSVENSHNTALVVRLYEGLFKADLNRNLIEAYKYAAYMCIAVEIKTEKKEFVAHKDKIRWKAIRDSKWVGNMKILKVKGLVVFKEDKKGSKGGKKNGKVKDKVDIVTDEISELLHEGLKAKKDDKELENLYLELEAIKAKIRLRIDVLKEAEKEIVEVLRRKNNPKGIETEEEEVPTLDTIA